MPDSSQNFISRNRKPRVHIEYKVETGDAIELVELPFIMGVMADLSGKPAEPLPQVQDRKFTEVDQDNFNAFLKAQKPRAAFQVENTISNDGSMLNVDLTFEKMEDFSPAAVAKKVGPLKELFDLRTRMSELLAKMDGRDDAEELMNQLMEKIVSKNSAAKTN